MQWFEYCDKNCLDMLKSLENMVPKDDRSDLCCDLLFLGFKAESKGRGVVGNRLGSKKGTWAF